METTPFLFSYMENCTDKNCLPAPCSKEDFERIINGEHTASVCNQILSEREAVTLTHERLSELKRQLPAFCFLANNFGGKGRKAENAVPSGLAYLDLDHIGDAKALWERLQDRAILNGCILAHITPSGEGLRIVFQRPMGLTVADSMAWFAGQIGITEYDTSVQDLSRISFAVPATYLLYRDDERLFDGSSLGVVEMTTPKTEVGVNETFPPSEKDEVISNHSISDKDVPSKYPLSYQGHPYSTIITQLLENAGFTLVDGVPQMGERHNALKVVVPNLRHICDFDPKFMMAVLPDWGLPQSEVKALVESAVNFGKGKSAFPRALKNVLIHLEREKETEQTAENEEEFDAFPLPAKLPRFVKKVLKAYPQNYQPAALISMLPSLGALATRVRVMYNNDEKHSLSFFACITSPQAGGKGSIKRLADTLLRPLQDLDEIEVQKLIEYEEAKEKAKNKKEQPSDPHPCLRLVPEKTSNTSLSQLLDNARGQHLVIITPEIDALAKNNKAVWSDMDEVLRKAFDNDRIGQFYLSDQSHKSHAEALINVMMTGTPHAMYNYFRNVEGGLVSRVAFAQLPSTYGKNIQRMGYFNDHDMADIQKSLRLLMDEGKSEEYARQCGGQFEPRTRAKMNADGEVERVADESRVPTVVYRLPRLDAVMKEWQDDRVAECRKERNDALDTFRRRACVIGFRAGVLFYILEGHRMTNEVLALSRWVADYVLDQQLRLFGGSLNRAFEKNQQQAAENDAHIKQCKKYLFDRLPDMFNFSQLMECAASIPGESTKTSTLRSHISRWLKFHMIGKVDVDVWRKFTAEEMREAESNAA